MESKELALTLAKLLDDKKGKDIKVLETGHLTTLADYFVICTGNSNTQVRALADTVEEEFEKIDILPLSKEGRDGFSWVILDYGDVIVHVFDRQAREFYSLDKLWSDAEEIDIKDIIIE